MVEKITEGRERQREMKNRRQFAWGRGESVDLGPVGRFG
jgi:hypothetical protein